MVRRTSRRNRSRQADPLGRLGTKVREQGVAVGEAGEAGGQDDLVAVDVDNDLTVVVALDRRIGVGVASVRGTVVAAGGGQQGAAEEEKRSLRTIISGSQGCW